MIAVQFLGIYTHPDTQQSYMVVEYVEGGSFQDLLRDEGDKLSFPYLLKLYFLVTSSN